MNQNLINSLNTRQFYIDGAWVNPLGQESVAVINPATEEPMVQLACAEQGDVNAAVSAAKQAFTKFSNSSIQERIELLEAINAQLILRNDDIAYAISAEMGAPYDLSISAQAPSGSQHFSEIINILKSHKFSEITAQGTIVKQEAIGVSALISPWNWPLNQIATKVAPALAAGCTMILKPSELAPLDAIILAEIMHEVGVPKGVFNLIHGTGAGIGDSLTSHKDVDMVSFTGSTRAGIAISHSCAPSIKRVGLELGGKSAGIIASEVDVDLLAKQVVDSSMLNSGQSCNALTRLLIPKAHYQEVSTVIAAKVNALIVDLPKNNPDIGPVANKNQYSKIKSMIQEGINSGATLLCGGNEKPNGLTAGYFIKPTVFGDVTPEMDLAREEIFGPVLSLMSYDTLEEAIEIANDSDYGLSGYVWHHENSEAVNIANQLRTGMVHINGKGLDSSAPFGGYKMSGNGREWGLHGLHEFIEYKSIYGGDIK
jgi:aldehyde dehydrogenase (NAD+)